MTDLSGEKIIAFNDIKKLHNRNKKKISKSALFVALLITAFFSLKPPQFLVTAKFKEMDETKDTSSVSFFKDFVNIEQTQASEIIQSNALLQKIVKKMGMQIEESHKPIIPSIIKRIKDRLKAEFNIFIEPMDRFVFENVSYSKEQPYSFCLRFLSENQFEVLDLHKKKLATGLVGEKIDLQFTSFTLESSPSNFKSHKLYFFTCNPLVQILENLQKNLQITSSKRNTRILNLSYSHRDRYFAANLIQLVMDEYQNYLKEDYEIFSQAQIEYLEKRHRELRGKLENALSDYALYLEKGLEKEGFCAFDQQISSYLVPYNSYHEKLLALELEEQQLQSEKPRYSFSPIYTEMNHIHQKIQDLNQQKDLLGIALAFHKNKEIPQNLFEKDSFEKTSLNKNNKIDELKKIRFHLKEVEDAIHQKNIPSSFSFAINQGMKECIHRMSASEGEICSEEEKDLEQYLQTYHHLLSVREKLLKQRVFQTNNTSNEIQGIDYGTSKDLYIAYNEKLDKELSEIKHLEFITQQMQDPLFEATSLSGILLDSISQDLIQKISELTLKIRDEKNQSAKEKERFFDDLKVQKKFLQDHILEMIQIKKLNANLFEDKMNGLQEVTLDHIQQQLSILDEQMSDILSSRKKNLLLEKELLKKASEKLKEKMVFLPEKWKLEKTLELNKTSYLNLMKTITNIVESKTIEHNLHRIQSKVIDAPYLPLHPQSFKLRTLFLVVFLLSYIAAFFYWVFRAFFSGFPLSGDVISSMNLSFCGTLSSHLDGKKIEYICDTDLESLRKIIDFITLDKKYPKSVALIGSKGPNYSYGLANLLSKKGLKILLIQCTFQTQFSKCDIPGILNFLNKEIKNYPIRKEENYDLITSGGTTRLGAELIGSKSFQECLEDFKKKYDMVLIYSKALAAFSEAKALINLTDKALISVIKETAFDLRHYLESDSPYSLSFVTV